MDYHGNNNSFFTSDIIYPDNNGEILIRVSVSYGEYAFINAMKLEDYTYPDIVPASISLSGDDITELGATSQMKLEYTPFNATKYKIKWEINDTSIARISSLGLVTPKHNGICDR